MIIGLTGRARHGKSVAADAILTRCEYTGISCAIQDIGAEVLAYCVENGLLPDKPRSALTKDDLAVLIQVGKEKRKQDKRFWILKCSAKIDTEVSLIPNIRYRNEAEWVKDSGGVIVRVTRPGFISHDRDPNDVSETEMLDWREDYGLVNTDEWLLRRQAVTLFDYLWEKGEE